MSAPAIVAKSLSSMTTLASNPPAYPRNPTHVRHEPLVLYIARVPGSRDVFLTPMKPRDRVVTAEDIQSSLYFVHVDEPEDVRFINPFPESGVTQHQLEPHDRPTAPSIQRKAAPATLVPPAAAPKRKPLPGSLNPVTNFESTQNIHAGTFSQNKHSEPSTAHLQRNSVEATAPRQENTRPPPPASFQSGQSPHTGTSLTLIRRDPSSSAQWNVAHIEDLPIPDVSSSGLALGGQKRTGAPLYIDVTNPGYSKFLHSETGSLASLVKKTNEMSMNSQNPASISRPLPAIPREAGSSQGDSIFRRRLWMEGSKYSNGGFGHRKMNSHDASIGRQSPRSSFEWQQERSSIDLRPPQVPPFLTRDDPNSSVQFSENQPSFRGYVFMSPWNGRCEFLTGAGGGSLKCRHVVPGLQGAPPSAMPVSELRFNLPNSSRAATPKGEDSSKRSSFFHRPRHSRHNSSVSEMDLSLGQEFAGGGFGGRQAKLGKLIIEDEGLKMLDLLVAANVALWWRAYEKVDGRSKNERGSF